MDDSHANHVAYEQMVHDAKNSLTQGHVQQCLTTCQILFNDSTIPRVFRVEARLLLTQISKRQADQWLIEADNMWAKKESQREVLRNSGGHFMKTNQHYVPRIRREITVMQNALFTTLHVREDALDRKDNEMESAPNPTGRRVAPSDQEKYMKMIERGEKKFVSGDFMECLVETVGTLHPAKGEEVEHYILFVARLLRTHCYLRLGQIKSARKDVQGAYNLWERKQNYIHFYASCERRPFAKDFLISHSAMDLEEWLNRTIKQYSDAEYAAKKAMSKEKKEE